MAILAIGCLEQRVSGLGWTLGDLMEEKACQLWAQTESFHDAMYHLAIAWPSFSTQAIDRRRSSAKEPAHGGLGVTIGAPQTRPLQSGARWPRRGAP